MPMNDSPAVPVVVVLAVAFWTASAVLIIAAWIVAFSGHQDMAVLMGLTAGVVVVAALAATLRWWLERLASLIRHASGLHLQERHSRPHRID